MSKKQEKQEFKTYKKDEFVALVAEKMDATKDNANRSVDAFIEALTDIVKNGDSVNFIGFGKFSVGERAAREGRNPKTGDKLKIKASKIPRFSAGKNLKDAVNVNQ
ncbi:HU family DNA-binding protein [Cysteiniphilum halobium]|uniref:HU family DNA-binding protein n=1 Tax=Cysteiniphilum halobium TaxID=2219059 RepID=UPI000E654FEB|nr:HU family DNA-binding protein [Cysteiniphilum halobium]